ncbi:hypothetical protein KY290_008035 [Solanum tuberosum]|uniref:CCHC-type domain-containing protein n=1 Tax=Solanum tuberosum TaxID=4113 RepID=A0ABQ7W971_SOLTU|nr:hypothetical protein KY290_008035 [Solanum tuberosum]
MNRKRDKDEALKRQTEWVVPRRGRKMTCSNCGIPGHNARGCHKFNQNSEEDTSNTGQIKSKKQKMDKQCDKGKKQTNDRHRTLIDEEDVEYPTPTQDCGGLPLDSSIIAATVEDFPLTASQPTQDCALDEGEDFGHDVEDGMPWKTRDFSELKSRTQQRQKQAQPSGSRRINFDCDCLTRPEDYAPKGLRKDKMDMRSNKEKKQANERHKTLIDEEDVEDFPLRAPQPTQDEDEDFGLDVEDDMP